LSDLRCQIWLMNARYWLTARDPWSTSEPVAHKTLKHLRVGLEGPFRSHGPPSDNIKKSLPGAGLENQARANPSPPPKRCIDERESFSYGPGKKRLKGMVCLAPAPRVALSPQ
jgi:hypothetical protein